MGEMEEQAVHEEVNDMEGEESKFTYTMVPLPETAYDIILFNSGSQNWLNCPDIWIGDTGATQHLNFSLVEGINKRECNVNTNGQLGTATSTLALIDFKVNLCKVWAIVMAKQHWKMVKSAVVLTHPVQD